MHGALTRRIDLPDAVVLGLGAMLGAGVFAVPSPAARAAGTALLAGLALAAVVAWCNAESSARLAALYPASGGTYVYGRERLGDAWGHLAGWGFVVGKTASCAAMALTAGQYLWPQGARGVALACVAAFTALGYVGVHRGVAVTRLLVGSVLAVLATAVVACAVGSSTGTPPLAAGDASPYGVLQSAGLMFFAFAGYARVATLGDEIIEPRRTIPRAIRISLVITLAVYALVLVTVLRALGPDRLAESAEPLADAVNAAGAGHLELVVRAGAAIASAGALLALLLGVSRTAFAMARDHHLPRALAAVHPRHGVPHRAVLAVGTVVAAVVIAADVRDAIGFSSFAVLGYYAVTNAAALTLDRGSGPRWVSLVGLVGCVTLAVTLPPAAVITGAAVLLVGAAVRLTLTKARPGPGRRP